MNYQETVGYLFSKLPMYQRIGAPAYKADLGATIALCKLLGNPERKFPSIHVAGTNGKGSVCHMLASVLQESGLRTGLYTSPHLKDFRERVKVNGQEMAEQEVITFVETFRSGFDALDLSFFEWSTGLAFYHFARERVDVAVIETGMGGRLDSTNVITPVLSVITNIGYDHSRFLGNTLDRIASEKAGIIKPGIPVVIGESSDQTEPVFRETARRSGSPIYFADRSNYKNTYKTDLAGIYQRKNIVTVLQCVDVLRHFGYAISEDHLTRGLLDAGKRTGLRGRWEVLCKDPLTVCDTGHNTDGIAQVLLQIQQTPHEKLHFVFGIVSDKDVSGIVAMLPREAIYYFCQASVPRSLSCEELKEIADRSGLKGSSFPSVPEALEAAKRNAGKGDMIFIGGSTFVVADIL